MVSSRRPDEGANRNSCPRIAIDLHPARIAFAPDRRIVPLRTRPESWRLFIGAAHRIRLELRAIRSQVGDLASDILRGFLGK